MENCVVLISDEKTKEIFTDALKFIYSLKLTKDTTEPIVHEKLQIYHPRDYCGCESPLVVCVGVEDSWIVEGITRAIRTLLIVDAGTHSRVESRMRLWKELEQQGLLCHYSQSFSSILDSLSDDDWRALNRKWQFLKIPRRPVMEADTRRETFVPEVSNPVSQPGAGRQPALGPVTNRSRAYYEISQGPSPMF
ncbi:unnamed protein product [Darwinula stevensoni]|uniref:Uncharacterized protein n=1 Tax=Darwinula stevensoni TaxID=69355 RepID=A0A7R9ACX0_9CRUS|nr:unnamed protein product [Darwinula stevensoni]CAG0900230.1 unnamed protein product [Darwinula stevensoni]